MTINDFASVSKSAWLRQATRELSADASMDSLARTQPDGFITQPYYTADDLADVPLAGQQAAQRQTPGWLNAPAFVLTDPAKDNAALRHAISAGADALCLPTPPATDLPRLLGGIKLSDTPTFFLPQPGATLTETTAFFKTLQQIAPYQWRGGFISNDAEQIAVALTHATDSPRFRAVGVDGRVFHNAGATPAQELALTIAQLADYYDHLTDADFSVNDLIIKTIISVSVGTDYFTEIAKLRALRVLWQRFLSSYELAVNSEHTSEQSESNKSPIQKRNVVPAQSKIESLFILAQTSTFYDASVTPHTNLLRATTEAMSATIGGCDALAVLPYDRLTNPPTDLGDRLARNVSLLLRDESQFGRVIDPSAGSYYIETLTTQLIEAAWGLFLTIEQMGGLAKATANGFVPELLETSYQAKVQVIKQGQVLVGVTKFRHDETPLPASSASPNPSLTDFGTILPDRRLAAEFE